MEQYIVSARKYRPSTFASVVGQRALTSTLKNAVATGRLAHSYLFCGGRGVGKTSCARIFAKTINCENQTPEGEACNECASCRQFNEGRSMNIIELDAASNNSVDDIRALVEQVQTPPSAGRYRVFIVDEVQMLSSAAFNAFLKTLEEPPSYVVFILATTEKHKIIPTILSRCQIYDFSRITVSDMVDHLAYVASSEGITADRAALGVIARKADGAMRDALSIFDQVAASSRGNITYQSAIDNLNILDAEYYGRLLDCFLGGRVLESWLIYKEIRDRGFDSHFLLTGLADYLRDLMVSLSPATAVLLEADDEVRDAMMKTASKCHPEFLYKALNLLNAAPINWRAASNKQFLLELTLAKICQLSGPSPSEGDAGEGRLKPIPRTESEEVSSAAGGEARAAAQAVSPAVSTPASVSPQPQAPPRPVAQAYAEPSPQTAPQIASDVPPPPVTRPVGASAGRIISNGPSGLTRGTISINRHNSVQQAQAQTQQAAQPAAERRNSFSIEQLQAAWQGFMNANPTRHILVNTMRASFPVLVEGTRYKVMIENEKQREELAEAMPELLRFVRDALSNDFFTVETELNRGEASPHTWNERQVLEHMAEANPAFSDFIQQFGLSLM